MYLPKSKYTGNLYSNGDCSLVGDNTPYIGYYFRTTDGRFYTGKYPTDGPNNELTQISSPLSSTGDSIEDSTYYTNVDYRFKSSNSKYSQLKNTTRESPQLKIPTHSYDTPSEQDYQVGEFTRYFSKKINENIYYETSALFQNELYIGFSIPWLLIGGKDKVYQTNMNMVMLKEQQLIISGLGAFINFNYLKFYKE